MKRIFSTADVRPQDRFDAWHEVASRYVTDHEGHPECRSSFEAKLCAAVLGDLTLVSFESASQRVTHGSAHVARANEELFVCRQVSGEMLLEQEGRCALLQPGDMTLLDPRMPYTGRLWEGAGALVVRFPRSRLQARVGRTGTLVARTLHSRDGDNRFVADFLTMLPAHTESVGLTTTLVTDQALDLLAVALSKAAGASGALVSSARFLVSTKLRAEIDRRLHDSAFGPAVAAAAAGISVRYANAVLADENTSLARLIQERRLERCRTAFADRRQVHRSIAEIAYGWGFSDMTHFGRRFKALYGQLPSEYRRQVVRPELRSAHA